MLYNEILNGLLYIKDTCYYYLGLELRPDMLRTRWPLVMRSIILAVLVAHEHQRPSDWRLAQAASLHRWPTPSHRLLRSMGEYLPHACICGSFFAHTPPWGFSMSTYFFTKIATLRFWDPAGDQVLLHQRWWLLHTSPPIASQRYSGKFSGQPKNSPSMSRAAWIKLFLTSYMSKM